MSSAVELELDVLGPTQVRAAGTAAPLRPRERHVLTALAVGHPQPASVETLIDRLWPNDIPASAKASIQNHVARIRTTLGDDAVLTGPAGYLLGPRWTVDVDVMDDALEAARSRIAGADHDGAVTDLRRALAMVRGVLASDLDETDEFDIERVRRADVVLAAEDDLLACLLVAADPRSTAVQAQALALAGPYREVRWEVLATALYRDDRRRDALRAIATGQQGLREVSGLDAGPRLRALESRILADDPTLRWGPLSNDTPRSIRPVRLVGRDDEWETLTAALDRATSDGAQLVLVEGDPGIGKSTLCGALVTHAAATGWRTVVAKCAEPGLAPSLWPVFEMVRSLAAANHRSSNDLVRWVIDAHVPSRPPAPTEIADQLLALIDSLVEQPTVLMVDDVHWADGATLAVLSLLVERLQHRRMLVLAAHRPIRSTPNSALETTLGSLIRAAPTTRVSLPPLTVDLVSQLIELTIGADPDASMAERVHTRSGGNPLFVVELARWEADRELSDQVVPTAIRDAVRQRLARVPAAVGAELGVAAVLGERFDVATVIAASERDRDACIAALGTAIDARILEAEGGTYRFVHAVVRDAVLVDINDIAAARLHHRIAEALVARFGDSTDHAEPVAHHRLASIPVGDPLVAAQAAVRASDVARWRGGLDAAEEYAERALQSLSGLSRTPEMSAIETTALQVKALHAVRRHGKQAMDTLTVWMREFADRTASDAARAIGLMMRWTTSDHSADLTEYAEMAAQARTLAERTTDPYTVSTVRYVLGSHATLRGDLGTGHHELQLAMAAVTTDADAKPQPSPLPVPPGEAGIGAALLGLVDDARTHVYRRTPAWLGHKAAVDRSAATTIAFTCAMVEAVLDEPDIVLQLLGDTPLAHDIAIIEQMQACGDLLVGWALARRGDASGAPRAVAALGRIEQGSELLYRSAFRTFAAAALLEAGDASAIELLASAREMAERRGERWWLSETIRLQAVAETRFGDSARSRTLMAQARQLALDQGAQTVLDRIPADAG